jgi:hypothetical protein
MSVQDFLQVEKQSEEKLDTARRAGGEIRAGDSAPAAAVNRRP